MKIVFNPIKDKDEIYHKVKELLNEEPKKYLIEKSCGSIGNALKLQQDKDVYEQLDKVLENIENKDLVDILNNSEVLYKEKDKAQEMLEYMTVSLYPSREQKKMDCIKYIEETKKRIIANSNYDMCIDYLLINMYRQITNKL